jgi:hypothetical protein
MRACTRARQHGLRSRRAVGEPRGPPRQHRPHHPTRRVTADEVEAVRALTPEAAQTRFAQAAAHARAAVQACAAPPPAEPAAAFAAAGARCGPPCCHRGGGGGGAGRTAAAGRGGACVCAGAELAFVPSPERAEVVAAGRAMRRLLMLLGLWNQEAFVYAVTRHFEGGYPCSGGKDAPPAHWDATLRGARMCRE